MGGNAHLAGVDGDAPSEPAAWGWRQKTIGTGNYQRDVWEPMGERVGWVEGDDVYLNPDASYKVAHEQAAGADSVVVTPRTLRKRHDEKGVLIREAKRDELTVRRRICGQSLRVLQLKPGTLTLQEPAKPDIPANAPHDGHENGDSVAGSVAGFLTLDSETRHENPPLAPADDPENGVDVGNGGNGGFSEGGVDSYEAEELAARREPGM